jgi:hypothetical protein
MVSFAGSMFAGVMKGATDSFSEKGLGGQLYNSIIAKQGRDLLDQQKRDSAKAGTGGFYGTQESGSSTPPAGGAGTPYGAGDGADKPTAGAPYVQEKPKPAPPPAPLKPFETITGDPSRGGPPLGMGSALPAGTVPLSQQAPTTHGGHPQPAYSDTNPELGGTTGGSVTFDPNAPTPESRGRGAPPGYVNTTPELGGVGGGSATVGPAFGGRGRPGGRAILDAVGNVIGWGGGRWGGGQPGVPPPSTGMPPLSAPIGNPAIPTVPGYTVPQGVVPPAWPFQTTPPPVPALPPPGAGQALPNVPPAVMF